MNSKVLLLLIVLVALVGLVGVALRNEPIRASVVDISSEWSTSGHADTTAEAWIHWDGADPPVVPANCAGCHSLHGYLDLIGEDGSPAGIADTAALTGTVLYCNGCHNDSAHALTSVSFPSGAKVEGLGHEATCMQCHQGRTAGSSVEKAITGKDTDTPDSKLAFINIHYFAAGATRMGSEAASGYQYQGATYAGRFQHTAKYDACSECHNPHSLKIDPADCSPCHSNVASPQDFKGINQVVADYDGDGNAKEGVAAEIEGLQATLLTAIQDYAKTVCGTAIAYDPVAYPYFMVDADGDGKLSAEETKAAARYTAYSPRLVQATYNYQAVEKDPGAFAHNPRYVVQLLHDSIRSLSEKVSVNMTGMVRP